MNDKPTFARPMKQLVALVRFRFAGEWLEPGAEFSATSSVARTLIAIRRAAPLPEPPPPIIMPPAVVPSGPQLADPDIPRREVDPPAAESAAGVGDSAPQTEPAAGAGQAAPQTAEAASETDTASQGAMVYEQPTRARRSRASQQ